MESLGILDGRTAQLTALFPFLPAMSMDAMPGATSDSFHQEAPNQSVKAEKTERKRLSL